MPPASASPTDVARDRRPGFFARTIGGLGAWGYGMTDRIIAILAMVGGVTWLLWDASLWLWRGITRQARLGRTAFVTQVVRIGVRSIGIVSLVCGAIGFILAMQMKGPLDEFGQVDKIANIVGVAVFRELGPLVAAIVLTGFAGAAIAAEIGTMAVGEEIEALEAHALNPIRFLVVPRFGATVLSLILLTVIADLVAVASAGVMTVGVIGVPFGLYLDNLVAAVSGTDFLFGLMKGGVFGAILASIACYNGLAVSGGAAGVGRATTSTVVQTIVAVVIADLVITIVLFRLGFI